MGLMVTILIIAFPLIIGIIIFNSLVALRAQARNGWAQIDVQLKRRADLVPNLVESVKGAMSHERETLENVVRLRNQAVALQKDGDTPERIQAEGALSTALGRLFALMENYPDIKATQNIASLQEELTSTENRIGFARQHYNDVATGFNARIEQIPANIVASIAGMTSFPLWAIEDAADRAAPRVALR